MEAQEEIATRVSVRASLKDACVNGTQDLRWVLPGAETVILDKAAFTSAI